MEKHDRYFTVKVTQTASKHGKGSSTLLVIREKQVRTTMKDTALY